MNKYFWKKAAVMAAAAVLGMQIAGCGQKDENTTAQKEFVYVPEYQELDEENGLGEVSVIGDTLYYITGSYDEEADIYRQYLGVLPVGENTPELIPLELKDDASIMTMGVDIDGNLQVVVNTYIYEEADTDEEGADQEEAAESGKEEDGEENESEAGEETEEIEPDTETESTVAAEEAGETGMIPEEDYAYAEPSARIMELYKLSTDGSIISKIDITEALKDAGDIYVQYMQTDKDGNIYIGYGSNIWVLSKEGKKLFELKLDGWLEGMFAAKDGTVFYAGYGAESMEVHPIDAAAGKAGDKIEGLVISQYGNYTFTRGTDTDILFSVDNDLYTYNMGDEEPEKVLNWIESDINSNDIRAFAALEDGRILVLTSSWDSENNTTELVYLTKKKGSEVPEKKILTYGTMHISYDARKQIVDFNKSNQEYRIEVKEYLTDYSAEAYGESLNRMNTDIVSGKCPDIIDVSGANMTKYASKGILEDLYPYIDADNEMKREDFLENILKAHEVDGKLYTISPRFYINTVLAKVSDVGERQSITFDELVDMADKMPEGTNLYEQTTKDTILSYNIRMNLDEYINWNTGECRFNSEEFRKALEFANRFDAEYVYDQDGPSMPTMIQEGSVLMMNASLGSVQEYQMYKGMFGEPIAFVGFPTTKDNGSIISDSGSMYAISSKSRYKDGAWQFIRQEFTEKEQEKDNGFGFPVMKSALELKFEQDMEDEYYEDADGNKHEQPKTTWGYDDFQIEIYAATENEIETVRNLIESLDTLWQYDEQVYNIVTEEAKAYFEGQKSVKDVADIIQSRVQIYVNENR